MRVLHAYMKENNYGNSDDSVGPDQSDSLSKVDILFANIRPAVILNRV